MSAPGPGDLGAWGPGQQWTLRPETPAPWETPVVQSLGACLEEEGVGGSADTEGRAGDPSSGRHHCAPGITRPGQRGRDAAPWIPLVPSAWPCEVEGRVSVQTFRDPSLRGVYWVLLFWQNL